MQKNGYVNNLVDMREQLRRNYRNAEDIPAAPVGSSPVQQPVKENRFDVEAQHDARDLEGRLLSALATAQNNANLLDFRRRELTERIEKLRALMAEMEMLSQSDPKDFRNKVDQLRYRFFEIAVEESEILRTVEKESEHISLRSAWIVAGAIMIGALLAAGAFFFSF